MTVPTRPRLRGTAVGEPQTDADPALGYPDQLAECAGRLPALQVLCRCQRMVGFWVDLDDLGHPDGFGALPQRLGGEYNRGVDARGLDLESDETAHHHEE